MAPLPGLAAGGNRKRTPDDAGEGAGATDTRPGSLLACTREKPTRVRSQWGERADILQFTNHKSPSSEQCGRPGTPSSCPPRLSFSLPSLLLVPVGSQFLALSPRAWPRALHLADGIGGGVCAAATPAALSAGMSEWLLHGLAARRRRACQSSALAGAGRVSKVDGSVR